MLIRTKRQTACFFTKKHSLSNLQRYPVFLLFFGQKEKLSSVPRKIVFFLNAFGLKSLNDHQKIASKNPAATAEPITPATLGPIACINR